MLTTLGLAASRDARLSFPSRSPSDFHVVCAQWSLQRGDVERALWATSQGLRAAPGDEVLYRDRMEAHDRNGRQVANFLTEHPKVQKVYYPGLVSHPQHELAGRQQKGYGGMVSFETGSLDNAKKVLGSVKLCILGESLGGVETLVSHPATMTHASIPVETRNKLGITDGLVRISVGIEDVEDIISDLDQALG